MASCFWAVLALTATLCTSVLSFPTTQGPPTTLGPPTTTSQCRHDSSKVENCMSFWCYNGRWQPFEFTATMRCCSQQLQHNGYVHPRCMTIFPEIFRTTPPTFPPHLVG